MKRLVIVESPTKAKTIRNFLKGDFVVEASMGHVRDLPSKASEVPEELQGQAWAKLGVNVKEGFEPLYIVPSDKSQVVRNLKKALKGADELYIATDEDREGESIGWHLIELLEPKVPVRRMVFHEITKDAIDSALASPREINQHLVAAQETRRILDRLVGYSLSPVLWRVVTSGLSAGRVQSVAVRLLVEREKERMAFVPASYWDLKAELSKEGSRFDAVMTHRGGIRLATGADFDDETGRLKPDLEAGKDVLLVSEEEARSLAARLPNAPWRVASINDRISTRSPAAPFITSTLQQEGSRKLGLSARDTMRVAQKLYEQGYITYMRTDSTNLSREALDASREAVERKYGKEYLSKTPRTFSNKVRNAQEAHEAIRPAGTEMKTSRELGLSAQEARLYDLIWSRTIASQMAEARLRLVTVQIDAGSGDDVATFRASGRTTEFAGFLRAYVEGSDDPEAALENRESPLPQMNEGDVPTCHTVEASGHETRPPARYTEATLIKTLESEGIGRPSTYASIIDTIAYRYARKVGSQLVPTFTAFAANNLLEKQFSQLVDYGFTANLETVLDQIAEGETDARPYLEDFYTNGIEQPIALSKGKIDPVEVSTIRSPKWNGYVVRVGQYGPYVEGELEGEVVRASLPETMLPGDVTMEELHALVEARAADDEVLGVHPEADKPVFLKEGPYGPYVQLGEDDEKPKRQSLPPGVDRTQVNFQMALDLLALPRELGPHPESGDVVKASIGRFGPYVQHKRTYASLKKGEDDVLTVRLERALELLIEKEKKNAALRTVGNHPESGDPVEVFAGRFGPYVKHGKINASLPKGVEAEDVTMDEALALLEAKASKGKAKKAASKSSAKKTTKKKPAAKKTAPKSTKTKAATRKPAAKKGGKKAG
jgi:DNA topoisomerase I